MIIQHLRGFRASRLWSDQLQNQRQNDFPEAELRDKMSLQELKFLKRGGGVKASHESIAPWWRSFGNENGSPIVDRRSDVRSGGVQQVTGLSPPKQRLRDGCQSLVGDKTNRS